MAAALSAGHLGALEITRSLRRLYIARDADPAGDKAAADLTARATAAGIDVQVLSPRRGDFNEDLQATGLDDLRAALRTQLDTEDAGRIREG
jgi:DNA primase